VSGKLADDSAEDSCEVDDGRPDETGVRDVGRFALGRNGAVSPRHGAQSTIDVTDGQILRKGGSGRVLGEGHGIAKGGEAFGVIAGDALRVQAVEVVAAQLAVRLAVPQDVVGDDEEAVGHGDDGLLVPRRLTSRRYWAAR
jgi:hypothetical protein